MAIHEALLAESQMEALQTRKLLERVPEEKLGWKPDEKSMTMSRLASHLAELPGWCDAVLKQDEFDIAPPDAPPYETRELESVSEILETFDAGMAKMREALAATSDEEFMKTWTLKKGGEEVFSAPKIGVVRNMLLNHAVHHRGQLSVYLRLTGVPVPATYGPSYDEPEGPTG
ncbi:MAG: DinB family protein [Gemmatimonadota bacterium]